MLEKKMAKGKKEKEQKQTHRTVQREERSFLYLLPEEISVKQMAETLTFLESRQIEVWTEINLLELTFSNATLTFEDLTSELTGEADLTLLASMQMKQVFACDYEAADSGEVQKTMRCLTERFGGVFASDTEDFKPFLRIAEL